MNGLPEPRSDLGLREGYHSPHAEVEVRLNTNESPLAPPPAWVEELAAAAKRIEYHRYPDRRAWELRRALAGLHGVEPERIFCANWSNEVLQSLCLAYGGPGRRALTFEPTYALHAHIAHLTGTEVVTAERRSDFTVDVDAAVAAQARTGPAITFLCSPNNPTGNAEEPAVVTSMLRHARGLVVVDEAYGQFADWSACQLLDEGRPLVVTRTFSKTWSMAGMRLGYALGPAPVVAMLERVALPYHLDALKQAAGVLAVAHVAEMEARVDTVVRERRRLSSGLEYLGVTVWPSQANFVLFRPASARPGADGRGEGRRVWQGLVDRSVLVRDTSSWPGLEGCLRVTVGTEHENDRFLTALADVLGVESRPPSARMQA